MRFGIFTFHNIPNYGAAFQALALCKAARELGADCEIIDYKCENIISRELAPKKNKNPVKTIIKLIFKKWLPREKRIKCFNKFMKNTGMVSENTYDRSSITKSNDVYNAFISGSDMIWDLKITDNDQTFFLDFVDNDKYRFSYASSAGENWGDKTLKIISLLKKYQRISTRESNVKEMIENNGLYCSLVCDPTLLLESSYWNSLAEKDKAFNKKNYVLVYFPYDGILSAAKKYAKENGLELLVISDSKKPFCGYNILKIYHPYSWLNAVRNANIVFTDSYHGILFSMYFKKNFWTDNRCNRIESILNLTELNERFIDCGVSTKAINYESVSQKLDKFRQSSLEYLSDIINITKKGMN